MKVDQHSLMLRLRGVRKITDEEKQQSTLALIDRDITASEARRNKRRDNLPEISYPENLPVSQKHQEIADAINNNQVVIIAGETGSGKTTQIPKICMACGRGQSGFIGHTQPRRLAARSVASRIADELSTPLGKDVGFKIRFSDNTNEHSYIKLMTDGILLAEMQQDRYLNQYDTLIIDEAHERSLNIDFLLGYLKQLLPKRPDLKVIITSATIDPDRFSRHFDNAPVIEVTGRTYPVEVRYRPVMDENNPERDQLQAIFDAVDELAQEAPGDVLIFMNGEREIRDTADALVKRKLRNTEILPLYARLSAAEQNRVFQSHSGRRIILATNVAETSLTVPGIKYVIDPGTARISRYSYRTKVQRLPIEPVSQASANQRKGRCGRVSDGICIRLYDEDDFNNRPEFTDPEILRTNLASVILQMLSLGLGDIESFPFVEAPDSRNINDGVRLLEELQATARAKADKRKGKRNSVKRGDLILTDMGKRISRYPVDPRLARMLVEAEAKHCLHEMMVITAGLSIQDPRERPAEFKQKSDESHQRFADEQSDFLSFINLWNYIQEQQEALSKSQFRKLCRQEFLSYIRVREWQDIYYQLSLVVKDAKITLNDEPAESDFIHQALLSGLLSHIGLRDENNDYMGARNSRFFVFPASALFKKQPKWIASAELVETSRLFGRINARIQPEWIEPLAQHLVNKSWSEPGWDRKRGHVMALEKQTLYGLPIVLKRRVSYSKVDPVEARELFIRQALVEHNISGNYRFLQKNHQTIDSIMQLENKVRRRDILIDEQRQYELYDAVVPADLNNQQAFNKWLKQDAANEQALIFKKSDLMQQSAQHITTDLFPDYWTQGNLKLPLNYHFNPGGDVDGVALTIPLALLNQVKPDGFEWSVPGFRHELIVSLIKSLPKNLRRNFVPAPDYATAVIEKIGDQDGDFYELVRHALFRITGTRLPEEDWDLSQVPAHLRMNFTVVNEKNQPMGHGESINDLKDQFKGAVQETLKSVADDGIEQHELTDWTFGELPESFTDRRNGFEIKAWPALVDKRKSVSLILMDKAHEAEVSSWQGVNRLILLTIPSPVRYLQQSLPNKAKLGLYYNPFGKINDLIDDCINAGCLQLIKTAELPRTESAFNQVRERVRAEIGDATVQIALQVEQVLSLAYDINKRLKGKMDLSMINASQDIKGQLDKLVFKGFVSVHGADKLADIKRYLQAVLRRLEKFPIDPNRDRMAMVEVNKAESHWQKLMTQAKYAVEAQEKLHEIRWMLEELRVSLFAQNIGTAYPVSSKRIFNALNDVSKML